MSLTYGRDDIKDGISVVEFQQLEEAACTWAKRDAVAVRELGKALIAVRDSFKYNMFGQWLKDHNIDRNRAYYAIRVVEGKVPKPTDTMDHPTRKLFKDAVVKSFAKFPTSGFSWKMDRKGLAKNAMLAAMTSISDALFRCGIVRRSDLTPEYKDKLDALMKALDEFCSIALVEPDAESKPVETENPAPPSPSAGEEPVTAVGIS